MHFIIVLTGLWLVCPRMVHHVLVCWSSALCFSSKQELLNCFVYNVDVLGLLVWDQATGHTFCLLILKLCLDTEISLFWFQTGPVCRALVLSLWFPCEEQGQHSFSKRKWDQTRMCVGKCVLHGGCDHNTMTLWCFLIPVWSFFFVVCFFVFTLCKLCVCFATKCF